MTSRESRRRQLGPDVLVTLGYAPLNDAQLNELAEDCYQTLQFIVGSEMTKNMTHREVLEIQQAIEIEDDRVLSATVASSTQELRDLVDEQVERIKRTLRQAAAQAMRNGDSK